MATALKPGPSRWSESSSYAKSADTRQAILTAAIEAFGKSGFAAVSTRQIAAEAGVNQPAIAYYFKNKEGLYKACAEEIVDRYVARTAAPSLRAFEALDKGGVEPEAARAMLKEVMASLADLTMASDDMALSAKFVEREMREPGTAYRYLYENFWAPGVEVVALLIGAIKGADRTDPSLRVEAIMLISGIIAFTPGQSVAAQAMGWRALGADQARLVLETVFRQIDLIPAAG